MINTVFLRSSGGTILTSDSEKKKNTMNWILAIVIGAGAFTFAVLSSVYQLSIEDFGFKIIICIALLRMIIGDIRETLKYLSMYRQKNPLLILCRLLFGGSVSVCRSYPDRLSQYCLSALTFV